MNRLVLVFWLAVGALVWAEDLRIRIETDPPQQARITKISGVPVDVAHQNSIYRFPDKWFMGKEPCLFRLQVQGYELEFQLTRQDCLDLPEDPENPGVRVYPRVKLVGLTFFVREHAVSLTAVAITLFMGVVVSARRYSESRRDRQKLDKMARISQSDGDPMVGRRLQNYLITQKLGSGGMAAVYRAIPFDTLDESEAVALKIIQDESRDEEFFQRFRREVEVTGSLNHPNTLRLFGWGEHEGTFFLVMELVQGTPLRVPDGGMSIAQFQAILPSLAAGMLYAHERGVVHRDLKPDNLMLMPNGQIKVMDFGLARSHEMKTVTATNTALGTPPYMAPEQVRGEKPSPLSDQYSLGITFYELLCGRRPFEQEELMAIIQAQLYEEPMPMQLYREEISMDLEQVIMRMLCKEPERRFPDLKQALQALQQAVDEMMAVSRSVGV